MLDEEVLSFLDYKFDPASGDLFRGGKRLHVPRQTSHLLAIFLDRPGKVITRPELQELLWPNGEFLDHEQAINRVVTDLRAVLRDSPKKPKYIETVHKRGYRFLPPISITRTSSEGDTTNAASDLILTVEASDLSPSPLIPGGPATTVSSSGAVPSGWETQQTLTVVPSMRPESQPRFAYRRALAASVVLVAGIGIAVGVYRHGKRPAATPKNLIYLGIAPFQSEGPGADEMGDSFRLDLADALSQIPVVQIRATNSLSKIGRDDNSIRNISQSLHLDLLLLGTFRVQGDRCTVQFELVRGRDSVHLASFQYDGRKDELALIRDKLQRDLFLTLQGKEKSVQSIRGSTEDPQAYAQYLEGRELARIRDSTALNQALAHYQLAIHRDPHFAQAYAGMATTHLALRYFNVSDAADHQDEAKRLAQQALQLDPQLAEPHAVLGEVAFRSVWNFALGESELRRAVELEPHKAIFHIWLAALLADERRFEEAQSEIDLAVDDDSLWPAVYSMATFVAGVARDNPRMLGYVQKYLSLVPDSSYSHDQLAWAYFSAKRYDEALAEWARMAEIDKDPDRIALEVQGKKAFRQRGILGYASVRLEAIERQAPGITRHANDFVPAEWYAFTGQRDKAMLSLESVVAHHDREAVQLAVNPMFDNLQNDPRFETLLHQVGLIVPSSSRTNPHGGRN